MNTITYRCYLSFLKTQMNLPSNKIEEELHNYVVLKAQQIA